MPTLFYEFSTQLTGYSPLSEELSSNYYDLLTKLFPKEFTETLNMYRVIKDSNPPDLEIAILDKIMLDQTFKDTCRNILKLWYLGKLDKAITPSFRPLFHYEALIWKTAHAHAPGVSGGYYGYWHYKPEN